ncbi:MAG: hypothetical protein IT326_05800, partial [Anaerolineae bacterium]|nr:hypothetical protein [Anaerolineae bacterium]
MMPIDISDSELGAILDACLEGITLHAWSVEECLQRYEPYRAVLGPLIRTAVALADQRQIAPSETFQSDSVSRLMARLPERTASLTGVTRRLRPIRGRFIPLFPTTVVVLIMLAALTLAGMLLAAGI